MGKTVERLQTSEIAARIFDESTIALTGSGIFLEADDVFAAIEPVLAVTTGRAALELAVAEGATMVRIGRALFGDRPPRSGSAAVANDPHGGSR